MLISSLPQQLSTSHSKLYRLAANAGIAARCPPRSSGSSYMDYGLSKACQLLHAVDLNLRFAADGQRRSAFAVEPGLVRTRIMRTSSASFRALNYWLLTSILKDEDQGTASALLCLLAPVHRLQGSFYFAECAAEPVTGVCSDPAEAAALADVFRAAWRSVEQ